MTNNERVQAWNKANPERAKEIRLRASRKQNAKKRGMTLEQYEEFLVDYHAGLTSRSGRPKGSKNKTSPAEAEAKRNKKEAAKHKTESEKLDAAVERVRQRKQDDIDRAWIAYNKKRGLEC